MRHILFKSHRDYYTEKGTNGVVAAAQKVGIGSLVVIMIFAFFNDILR
jgi:membrane-associated protease RseP (regulator of RpoE activity)